MEGVGQGGLQAQGIPESISLFLLALPVTLWVSHSLSICWFLEALGPQRPRFKSSEMGCCLYSATNPGTSCHWARLSHVTPRAHPCGQGSDVCAVGPSHRAAEVRSTHME